MNFEPKLEAPPPLDDNRSYQAWRAAKLRRVEQVQGLPRVDMASLTPNEHELQQIWRALGAANMVLVRLNDTSWLTDASTDFLADSLADSLAHGTRLTGEAILRLGRRLGLKQLDRNPCADDQAVSRLENRARANNGRMSARIIGARPDQSGPAHKDQPHKNQPQKDPPVSSQTASPPRQSGRDYIPYTDRALGWHTDGYYNPPEAAVRAWMLFCVRPAISGGENALLDPELAYLWLRDRDPALIKALMDSRAFSIPANRSTGQETRPRTRGPVFALRDGQLLMRYSARARNIEWHPAAETARAALSELFSSGSDFILRHKLSAGEGYITRNVLHTRTAFTDSAGVGGGRLVLRVRYRDALKAWAGSTTHQEQQSPPQADQPRWPS